MEKVSDSHQAVTASLHSYLSMEVHEYYNMCSLNQEFDEMWINTSFDQNCAPQIPQQSLIYDPSLTIVNNAYQMGISPSSYLPPGHFFPPDPLCAPLPFDCVPYAPEKEYSPQCSSQQPQTVTSTFQDHFSFPVPKDDPPPPAYLACSPTSSSSVTSTTTDSSEPGEPVPARPPALNKHNRKRTVGRNQLGRAFSPGIPLSLSERQFIVRLYHYETVITHIDDLLGMFSVPRYLDSTERIWYRKTGSVKPKDAKEGRPEGPLITAIRDYQRRLGICSQTEIRAQLLRDGLCTRDTLPSSILRTKFDIRKRRQEK